jgi:hypothetical protein
LLPNPKYIGYISSRRGLVTTHGDLHRDEPYPDFKGLLRSGPHPSDETSC